MGTPMGMGPVGNSNGAILVTGGAGFIGSNFVLKSVEADRTGVVTWTPLRTWVNSMNNIRFMLILYV